MGLNKEKLSSPFFSRNYGGFSKPQKEYYESSLDSHTGLTILDPMSGQGFYLSELIRGQNNVWLGDINPSVLMLAYLRDPIIVLNRDEIFKYTSDFLNRSTFFNKNEKLKYEYNDKWLSDPIEQELESYANALNTKSLWDTPNNQGFWNSDPYIKFVACLPVLAAREIVNFYVSDNKTWNKPGGLIRETSICNSLKNALNNWYNYASHLTKTIYSKAEYSSLGTLNISTMDSEIGNFGVSPTPDIIITSPPYANRLDYTRIWYPEIIISSRIISVDIEEIKKKQLGTNVVSNKPLLPQDIKVLPKEIQRSLEEIKNDESSKASRTYYYPFFSNYAISLRQSLVNMAKKLKNNGMLIIFIRDTVRKDTLFPTSVLIKEVLLEELNFSRCIDERRIIKNHIGLIRRAKSQPSLYGLAQQEWWMTFYKE